MKYIVFMIMSFGLIYYLSGYVGHELYVKDHNNTTEMVKQDSHVKPLYIMQPNREKS